MAIISNERHLVVCVYCKKPFSTVKGFKNHSCVQYERYLESKRIIGQAAYLYYKTWLKEQRKVPPHMDTFLESRFYKSFIRFVDFAKKVSLPYPTNFIKHMIKHNLYPMLWTSDYAYTLYMNYLDTSCLPIDMAKISVKTMLKYSEENDIGINEVLEHMHSNDLIYLIRIRKLSPWLLLFCKTFKQKFVSMTEEQQKITEQLIKPSLWKEKKELYPDQISNIKLLVNEMGI